MVSEIWPGVPGEFEPVWCQLAWVPTVRCQLSVRQWFTGMLPPYRWYLVLHGSLRRVNTAESYTLVGNLLWDSNNFIEYLLRTNQDLALNSMNWPGQKFVIPPQSASLTTYYLSDRGLNPTCSRSILGCQPFQFAESMHSEKQITVWAYLNMLYWLQSSYISKQNVILSIFKDFQ